MDTLYPPTLLASLEKGIPLLCVRVRGLRNGKDRFFEREKNPLEEKARLFCGVVCIDPPG